MKKFLILLLLFASSSCFAAIYPRQLIIVITPHLNSATGQLQRYDRNVIKHSWEAVGESIPVLIGRHGLSVAKKEGDNTTPVGIFAIGPTFGFDENNSNKKMDYIQLSNNSICVDDVNSSYYNKLINSDQVSQKDWNSGERMRKISQYKYGVVVQYNSHPIIPGAGSCIFLHAWEGLTNKTSGCIAMEEANLIESLNWLDAKKHPVIAIFPRQMYGKIREEWRFPEFRSS